MSFLLTAESNEELVVRPETEDCIKDEITFTSQDILEFKTMLESYYSATQQTMNIQDLVNYFNTHFECNKIIKLFKEVVEEGFKIKPKLAFLPTTERCEVKDGKFTITRRPLEMNGFYFLNNLVVVKYPDNTFNFFTDVKVNLETLECDLGDDKVNGECYVSYNYLMETA